MKIKKLSYLLYALALCFVVSCSNDDPDVEPVNELYLNIPDVSFETILIEEGIDSDGIINHQILKSDAAAVTRLILGISLSEHYIYDLTGIEGFTNLTRLYAYGHDFSTVDLSANTKLDTVILANNNLESMDFSNNPNLIYVDMQVNELHSVTGLSDATSLKYLNLSWNNMEEFSLHNPSIEVLMMSHNFLKTFDISGSTSMTNILLVTNQLTSIDLSTNTLLETLVLSDNKLESINLAENENLTHLWISSNSLIDLDVSRLPKLAHLTIHNNPSLSCVKIDDGQYIPTVTKTVGQKLNSNCN